MPAKCQFKASQAWLNCLVRVTSERLFVTSPVQSSQTSVGTPLSVSRFSFEKASQSLHVPSGVSVPVATASLVTTSR